MSSLLSWPANCVRRMSSLISTIVEHRIKLGLLSQVCLLLAAAMTSTATAKDRGRHLDFDVSGARIAFDVPGSPSRDVPRLPPKQSIDLSLWHEYTRHKAIALFRDIWDFRRPFRGALASVLVTLDIFHDFEITDDLRCLDRLKALVVEFNESSASRLNPKRTPDLGYIQVPREFSRVALGNTEWLRYDEIDGDLVTRVYSTGVFRDAFISLRFQLVDNADPKDRKAWEPWADRLIAGVLATVQVVEIPARLDGFDEETSCAQSSHITNPEPGNTLRVRKSEEKARAP